MQTVRDPVQSFAIASRYSVTWGSLIRGERQRFTHWMGESL